MEINHAFDELTNTIKESSVYLNYDHILKQVKKSSDINNCIDNIKQIQKKLVQEEHSNGSNIETLKNELFLLNENLYNNPLYMDYLDAALALEDLLKAVSEKIQKYVDGLDI